jgi:polyphosphate kinase 2 (PPK2 family)
MKMQINSKDFRVPAREKLHLKKWPTLVKPVSRSKKEYAKLLQEQVEELSALQRRLYASNCYAVLLIFQAMDAAGKDDAIRHVMSGVNPQGCQVFSFKHPSALEPDHDFLWRTTRSLPERGRADHGFPLPIIAWIDSHARPAVAARSITVSRLSIA